MRKIIIFAALAALAMISSCQKEAATEQESDDLTFTASIVDQSTRTTIDTDANSETKGKVNWVFGDEIQVRSRDGRYKAVYYIKSDSDITAEGIATFTYKSGTRLPSGLTASGNYYATYGDYGAITEPQAYSATVGKLPMYGEPDPSMPTRINFTVRCGLLKLKLAASSDASKETISKIEVSGRCMDYYNEEYQDSFSEVSAVFTLTCTNEYISSSAKDFYIALPAGEYTTIKFTNGTGHISFKTSKSPMTISANEIKTLTFTGLTFDDKLPGKFSVAPGRQVQFSRGNLYCKRTSPTSSDWKWGFYEQQYQYNSLNTGETRTATTDDTEIDLFCWSYDPTESLNPIAKIDGNPYADKWGEGTGWFMLYGGSDGEMTYLLDDRIVNGGTGEGKSYQRATVNSVYGTILYPDGYTDQNSATKYDRNAWSIMENAGCVFLPAAGVRNGSSISEVGSKGYCWLGSCHNPYNADCVYINGSYVSAKYGWGMDSGLSIRLVSNVTEYYGNLNGGAANMEWGDDDSNNWE